MKLSEFFNITKFPYELHDKHESVIYAEYSSGYWVKYEYDSNGRLIYYKSSTGSWIKREYDSQGNVIYHETSVGVIVDNRPKKSCSGKVVEIDGVKYTLTEVEE